MTLFEDLMWSASYVALDLSSRGLGVTDMQTLHAKIFTNPALLAKIASIDLRDNLLTDAAVCWLWWCLHSPVCARIDLRGNPLTPGLPMPLHVVRD